MCLWSCWKRSSLQNFTKLTQPFLPVWGISSKRRTCSSTPPFLLPGSFLPANFPWTSFPAAVTAKALCGVTPHSRLLSPQAPWTYMLLISFRVVSGGLLISLAHPQTSYPWMGSLAPMSWQQKMICGGKDQSSRESQHSPNPEADVKHTAHKGLKKNSPAGHRCVYY